MAAYSSDPRIWSRVLWRLAAVMLLGGLLGQLTIGFALGLILAGVGYIGWHIYNLYLLERWLRTGKVEDLPDSWGIWRDIFDRIYRLQQAEKIRQRELGRIVRRFRKSSSAMPDGVVVLDSLYRIDWFNHAAAKLLGLRKKKDLGQRVTNLVRDPRLMHYLSEADFTVPLEIVPPDQPDWVLSLHLVPYDSGQFLMLVRNVTRMRQLEQVRREFVSNASHELRTPLTVIRGYVDMLADETEQLPKHWQKAWKAIAEQTLHMQRLVRDLMVTVRLDEKLLSQRDENIDMCELIDVVVSELRPLAEPQIKLSIEANPKLLLRGNVTEIQSVITNLLSNAINYMPSDYALGEGKISLKWRAKKDGAELLVKDNGAGIAPEHIEKITERFYRVNNLPGRIQQGTGLGLTIVKQAVRRHDGKLSIDSKLGQGAKFSCTFPASRILTEADDNLLKLG